MNEDDKIRGRPVDDRHQYEMFVELDRPERSISRQPVGEEDLDLEVEEHKLEKQRKVQLGEGEMVEVFDDPTPAYIHSGQTGAGVRDQQATKAGSIPELEVEPPAMLTPAVGVVPDREAMLEGKVPEEALVLRPEARFAPEIREIVPEAEARGLSAFQVHPVFAPTEKAVGIAPAVEGVMVARPEVSAPSAPVNLLLQPASGQEDQPVSLDISLDAVTGGERVTIKISNLPEGASLSAGVLQADGSWLLQPSDIEGLFISLPEHVSGDFILTLEVFSIDASGQSTPSLFTLPLSIAPVADTPSLEATLVDNGDGTFSLVVEATLIDADGSEILSLGLRGVPEFTIISDGVKTIVVGDDGTADLTGFDVTNIRLSPPEEQYSFTFEIFARATDATDVAETLQQIDVFINAPPETLTFTSTPIAENASAGTIVGHAVGTDPDADVGDVLRYSLAEETPDIFTIDPDTGEVRLAAGAVLDYETQPNYTLTIEVTDALGETITRSFVVDISNVAEAPTDITLDNLNIFENAAGAIVGTLGVADPDVGGSHSYAVSDPRFEVVDGELKLLDTVSLNHEIEPNVTVDVTVRDEAGNIYTESFTLNVGNVAEAPTDITLDNLNIFENDKGAVVGTISVLDEDVGDTVTYEVSDPRFIISAGRLKLAPNTVLNHEVEPQVDIDVTVTDSAGLSYTETFTIDVLNQSEAPTDITIDNLTVDENTPGAIVGNISVLDEDVGDSHSFVLSDDRFEVVGGQLKLKEGEVLDFEGDRDMRIRVEVTDDAGNSYTESFIVTINDINEAPIDIALANDTVDENAAGAIVGALSVEDPDAGDTHSYTVSDARFEVVDGNLKLVDGISLDFETEPNVLVDVTAVDENGLSFTETLTVNVEDTGDAPTDIAIDNLTVLEDDAGAVIGNVTVSDPDAGDRFSYVVSDDRFSISKGQLVLDRKEALDYETEPQVSIDVTVTDSDGFTYTETFIIEVLNANDPPTDIALDNTSVDEGSAGLVVGNLTITDPDVGDSYVYSLSDPRFEVVGDELRLLPNEKLDFESEPVVDIDITATDTAGNDYTETFSLNVGDIVWPEDTPPAGLPVDNTYTADADTIRGGNQPDVLWGGEGADTILGRSGGDTLYGGTGDDTLEGGQGADTLYGGGGADLFNFDVDGGNDFIAGGEGSDTLDLSAMADAGVGWTIAFADGSEVTGSGADYLELSSESAGIITFDDGTEVQFEGLEDIQW